MVVCLEYLEHIRESVPVSFLTIGIVYEKITHDTLNPLPQNTRKKAAAQSNFSDAKMASKCALFSSFACFSISLKGDGEEARETRSYLLDHIWLSTDATAARLSLCEQMDKEFLLKNVLKRGKIICSEG